MFFFLPPLQSRRRLEAFAQHRQVFLLRLSAVPQISRSAKSALREHWGIFGVSYDLKMTSSLQLNQQNCQLVFGPLAVAVAELLDLQFRRQREFFLTLDILMWLQLQSVRPMVMAVSLVVLRDALRSVVSDCMYLPKYSLPVGMYVHTCIRHHSALQWPSPFLAGETYTPS
jgi:hypothetical protein